MKSASMADVKARFGAYVKESEQEPILVTRNGRPVAVLLSIKDESNLERLLSRDSPRLEEILDAAQRRIESGGGISHDVFWKDQQPRDTGAKRGAVRKNGQTKRSR
jgi:prevent-host-death family protein